MKEKDKKLEPFKLEEEAIKQEKEKLQAQKEATRDKELELLAKENSSDFLVDIAKKAGTPISKKRAKREVAKAYDSLDEEDKKIAKAKYAEGKGHEKEATAFLVLTIMVQLAAVLGLSLGLESLKQDEDDLKKDIEKEVAGSDKTPTSKDVTYSNGLKAGLDSGGDYSFTDETGKSYVIDKDGYIKFYDKEGALISPEKSNVNYSNGDTVGYDNAKGLVTYKDSTDGKNYVVDTKNGNVWFINNDGTQEGQTYNSSSSKLPDNIKFDSNGNVIITDKEGEVLTVGKNGYYDLVDSNGDNIDISKTSADLGTTNLSLANDEIVFNNPSSKVTIDKDGNIVTDLVATEKVIENFDGSKIVEKYNSTGVLVSKDITMPDDSIYSFDGDGTLVGGKNAQGNFASLSKGEYEYSDGSKIIMDEHGNPELFDKDGNSVAIENATISYEDASVSEFRLDGKEFTNIKMKDEYTLLPDGNGGFNIEDSDGIAVNYTMSEGKIVLPESSLNGAQVSYDADGNIANVAFEDEYKISINDSGDFSYLNKDGKLYEPSGYNYYFANGSEITNANVDPEDKIYDFTYSTGSSSSITPSSYAVNTSDGMTFVSSNDGSYQFSSENYSVTQGGDNKIVINNNGDVTTIDNKGNASSVSNDEISDLKKELDDNQDKQDKVETARNAFVLSSAVTGALGIGGMIASKVSDAKQGIKQSPLNQKAQEIAAEKRKQAYEKQKAEREVD